MKTLTFISLLAAALVVAGCGKRKPPATAELVDAFPPATEAATANAVNDLASVGGQATAEPVIPRVYAQETVHAIQGHDYVTAMNRLQTLQHLDNLSVPQRIAVQNAMDAVQTQLAIQLSQGNTRAKQEAEQIRQNALHH